MVLPPVTPSSEEPDPQNDDGLDVAVPLTGVPLQVPEITLSNAPEDVAVPAQLVTTQRYAYPSQVAGTPLRVSVLDVAVDVALYPAYVPVGSKVALVIFVHVPPDKPEVLRCH